MRTSNKETLLLSASIAVNCALCLLLVYVDTTTKQSDSAVISHPQRVSTPRDMAYVGNTLTSGAKLDDNFETVFPLLESGIRLPLSVLKKNTIVLGEHCKLTDKIAADLNLSVSQRAQIDTLVLESMQEAITKETERCKIIKDSSGDEYLEIPASPDLLASARSELSKNLQPVLGASAAYTAAILTADCWFQSLNVVRRVTINYGQNETPEWEIKTFWPQSEPAEESVQFALDGFLTKRYAAEVRSFTE